MPVRIDTDTCVGCGACTDVCPTGSLNLDADGKCQVNEDTCLILEMNGVFSAE